MSKTLKLFVVIDKDPGIPLVVHGFNRYHRVSLTVNHNYSCYVTVIN